MKKILILFATIVFCFANLKAQDDPIVGIYADGVKVTELNCYSFKNLTVVLPYNEAYGNYDKLRLFLRVDNRSVYGFISKAGFLSKNVKGKYFVYEIFTEGSENMTFMDEDGATYKKRGFLAFFKGDRLDEAKVELSGMSISGYKEVYDDGCSCVKKTPQYSYERLSDTKIKLIGRKKAGFKEPSEMTTDMSQPCTYPGIKVDFNSLGGKSSSGNSNTKTGSHKKDAKKEDGNDDDKDKD